MKSKFPFEHTRTVCGWFGIRQPVSRTDHLLNRIWEIALADSSLPQ